MPWNPYPFLSDNSARYEPSWPVMPVSSMFFIGTFFACGHVRSLTREMIDETRTNIEACQADPMAGPNQLALVNSAAAEMTGTAQ